MKKLFIILACVCFCAVGCKQQTTQQNSQNHENIESDVNIADMIFCQSCCMPLADDLYGTNADGTVNEDYCKYCYMDGAFTAPDLSMEEMIAICIPYMVEQGMAAEDARYILESTLPNLKRWQ